MKIILIILKLYNKEYGRNLDIIYCFGFYFLVYLGNFIVLRLKKLNDFNFVLYFILLKLIIIKFVKNLNLMNEDELIFI